MLKALSDHVSATFAAGERLEDVQSKMLQEAVRVLGPIGTGAVGQVGAGSSGSSGSGSGGSHSQQAQRLENPYRSAGRDQ